MRRRVVAVFLSCIWAATAWSQISSEPQSSAPPTRQGETSVVTAKPQEAAEPSDKPLPKIDELIAKAKSRQSANEELRRSYTCKQTVVADEFDSHGNKKGSHSDEYQVWQVQRVEVHQHVAHDGKPLSPEQAQKEQARIDKEIADIKSGNHKEPKGNVALTVSNLLKVATFSNERRVDVNGRPTIEFDYTGDPNAKASDIGQEVMKKLSGELWLDEEDAAVVHLQGKLKENFHVGGGLLVNVQSGSWFEMNTVHLNGEIWFVEHLQAHADGRFLLFKGFDGDANVAFSDYRKMRTSVTVLPGSQVIGEDGKPIPNLQVEPDAGSTTPKPAGVPKQ